MKNVLGNAGYWAGGILAAAIGVLLARVIGPHQIGAARLWLTIGGQFLALSGLLLICVGVSRRVNRANGTSS